MKINIVRPVHPRLEELSAAFESCLNSGLVTNGSHNVQELENRLQSYYSCPIRPSVNCNGEMALFHLFQAWKHKFGLGPHDSCEALVPSFTFSGTINALVTNNIKPVFCDVDSGFTLDLDKMVFDSPSIRFVVPVGAYGNLVDLENLSRKVPRDSVAVVLDNAPAFGSKFNGQFPWRYGFSEMVSFHATKIFSCMEGGACIVNDEEVANYLLRLRDFGQYEKTRGNVDIPGLNSKMTEICALVGLRNLEKIDDILNSRLNNVKRYLDFFESQESLGRLQIMKVAKNVTCTYLYFPVLLNEDATEFVMHMQAHGIGVRRYYTATHQLDVYRGKYRSLDLSFTEGIKDRIVALPIHTYMSDDEMDYLFTAVRGFFE